MRLRLTWSRGRTALVASLAAASVAMTAAGCSAVASASANSGHHQYVMHDNANGKTIWVHPGDKIEVILASTYWNVKGSSAPKVVRQVHATVLMPRPSSCPHIPGLGCTPERTDFVAVSHGKAVITASRTTCGEAMLCTDQDSHFTLIVRVH